jgi:hypothetical protein
LGLISRIVTLDDLTVDFRSIDRTPLLRDRIWLIGDAFHLSGCMAQSEPRGCAV